MRREGGVGGATESSRLTIRTLREYERRDGPLGLCGGLGRSVEVGEDGGCPTSIGVVARELARKDADGSE